VFAPSRSFLFLSTVPFFSSEAISFQLLARAFPLPRGRSGIMSGFYSPLSFSPPAPFTRPPPRRSTLAPAIRVGHYLQDVPFSGFPSNSSPFSGHGFYDRHSRRRLRARAGLRITFPRVLFLFRNFPSDVPPPNPSLFCPICTEKVFSRTTSDDLLGPPCFPFVSGILPFFGGLSSPVTRKSASANSWIIMPPPTRRPLFYLLYGGSPPLSSGSSFYPGFPSTGFPLFRFPVRDRKRCGGP